MKTRGRQTTRFIWTAAIIIGVLFVLNLMLAGSSGRRQYEGLPSGSTYSSDPDGAQLFYRTLEELGFETTRHRNPLLRSEIRKDSADVIWHSYGSVPVGEDEIQWISEWVTEGGTLVLIADPLKQLAGSPELFSVEYDDILVEEWLGRFEITSNVQEVQPLADNSGLAMFPHRMIVGAPIDWELGETREIHTYKRRGLVNPVVYRFTMANTSERSPRSVIRDGYGTVLAWGSYGGGQVWVVADPYLFSNLLLKEADNSTAAISLVLGSRGGESARVLFDEYHLGFVQSKSLSDAARTPFGKGVLFLGLISVLAIGIAGARFGPVRKAPGAIGVSQRAFVKALAGLWQGAGASTAAADALWRRYGSRQGVRRKGLDTRLDEMRKSRPKPDDLLEIARKLDLS